MPQKKIILTAITRNQEIVENYLELLTNHIKELACGNSERSLGISDFAKQLCIHPVHLSNTLREVTGKSPCTIYEEHLLQAVKEMLLSSDQSIASIAHTFTYDPSNFSKFFKEYTGITPGEFRKQNKRENT